jgi:exonuclease SbcD
MPHRLLLSGDLHLGRSSSHVPDSLQAEARTVNAWRRLVDLALAEPVDAVLLSGDVVDENNRFMESIGPLESGINRLAAKGIPVLAVAGNHDCAVLERLATHLPPGHFRLLGRRGAWERVTLMAADGRPWLHVDGWSFPESVVRTSPLTYYNLPPPAPGIPLLGLVHGDLDTASTRYAPLARASLQALPPQAWLLGHIHASSLVPDERGRWLLMPGSPQALDPGPGETGAHGPWIVEVEGASIGQPRQQPLSSVWYDSPAPLDVSQAASREDLEDLIISFLRKRAADIKDEGGAALKHINLRLRLNGDSPCVDLVRQVAEQLRGEPPEISARDVTLTLDDVIVEVMPRLDLKAEAGSGTVRGAVAALLLELAPGGTVSEETRLLLDHTRQTLVRVENANDFRVLMRPPPSEERIRAIVESQARALLAQLTRMP